MKKAGVLLVNLGSPLNLKTSSIRFYLKTFLSDKRVIDIPLFFRFLILYLFILPFRPKKTKKAYEMIWTEQGSPLIVYTKAFADKLRTKLSKENYSIEVAMRYGEPSFKQALERLKKDGCQKIIFFPLYPQYAPSTTATALEHLFDTLKHDWDIPSIQTIDPFYDHPLYIASLARLIQQHHSKDHHLLFSFHGTPTRHIAKSEKQEEAKLCYREEPCTPEAAASHPFCYRAQCYATSSLTAKALDIADYSVCFQSRFGSTPWIGPYFEDHLKKLIAKKQTKLTIVCPAFTVDCLETLEEIAVRGRDFWMKIGGTAFILVPCLNDDDCWVEAAAKLIK